MVFQPDTHARESKQRPKAAERYREGANRLTSLMKFMKEGGRWEQLDPSTLEQHRASLRFLNEQKAGEPTYQSLSLAQVAEDLIRRYEVAIQEQKLADLKTVGDIVYLPKLTNRRLEVIKVDRASKSYILADVRDQRDAEQLVRAVWSGEELPDGQPVGYEVDWDQLEQLAA